MSGLVFIILVLQETEDVDMEFLREMQDPVIERTTVEREAEEVTYTKKAVDQLRGLISDIYALEESK